MKAAQAQADAQREYIQSVAVGATSTADEIARLGDLKDKGVITDAEFQAVPDGRLATDAAAIRCMGYRGFAKSVRGEMPPEHMVLKLFSSEAEQRACEVARDALGTDGLDLDGAGPRRFTDWDVANFDVGPAEVMGAFYDGAWADQYWRSFSHTIAGGTSEIQRNIVAERVLGLPRA